MPVREGELILTKQKSENIQKSRFNTFHQTKQNFSSFKKEQEQKDERRKESDRTADEENKVIEEDDDEEYFHGLK